MVISEGDTIEVDAESTTELETEFQTIGFLIEAANQISTLATSRIIKAKQLTAPLN